MILVFLLLSVEHTLLKAETYKRAFTEHKIYEQVPDLMAGQFALINDLPADPCAGSPPACTLQDAPAEVQVCAQLLLGQDVYQALYTNARSPTKRETRRINSCFRQIRREARATNPSTAIGNDLIAFVEEFTSKQWNELLTFLFPNDSLQHLTESALDQVFLYLHGETGTAKISLVNLKARLIGKTGDELILLLLKEQPPCTEEQKTQIDAGNFENGAQRAIYCSASGDVLDKVMPEMQKRLSKVVAQIPDEAAIQLPSPFIVSGSRKLLGNEPQAAYKKINSLIRYSPLLPFALLLLAALLVVRSLRGWMRWWSIPILIASLIVLITSTTVLFLFDWAWAKYVMQHLQPMLAGSVIAAVRELAHTLTTEFAKWTMLESGITALLALGILIASSRVQPPPDPDLPPLAPPGTPGGPVLSARKRK